MLTTRAQCLINRILQSQRIIILSISVAKKLALACSHFGASDFTSTHYRLARPYSHTAVVNP